MCRVFRTASVVVIALSSLLATSVHAMDADLASVAVASTATDASREVTGRVVLAPRLADGSAVQARLSIDAGAGVPAAPVAPLIEPKSWRDVKVSAQAVWSAASTRVSLEALDEMRFPGDGGLREDRTARAGVQLKPLQPVTLDLRGEVTEAQSVQPQPGATTAPVIVRKDANAVSAGLTWTIMPQLVLKGAERLEDAALAWRGQGLYQGDGATVQPRLEGQLKPWTGTELNLVFERSASPFDTDKFAALASAMFRVEPDGAVRAFRPDQEWRLAASGAQQLGPARLSLSLADASLISSTELGLTAIGSAAPTSVQGGWRSDLQLGLDVPLQVLGRASARIRTAFTVRASALRDPVTGLERPISGQTPYEGKVSLEAETFLQGLTFGLDTRLTGPRTYYEIDRLRAVDSAELFGSFVEYRANQIALRLQIDNLLNDASHSTETLFQRDRSTGQVVEIDHRDSGGTGISLTLTRKV